MRAIRRMVGCAERPRPVSAMVLGMLLLALVFWPSSAAAAGATYVVQPGDTLGLIAATYGITVEAIMQANGLTSADYIRVGQKLTIPTSGEDDQGTDAGAKVYIVKYGDTVASIAHTLGVSQVALLSANNLSNPDLIWIGQKLVIPGPPAASTLPAAQGGGTYTVRPGDTLGQIALRYGVTPEALASANRLADPDLIYVGLELTIPGDDNIPVSTPGQGLRFVVSISQQRCWLYSGSLITANWACSTGQYGAGTNPGTYFVQSKLDKAYGSTWNIWMPYWLGIYWAGGSENGIHGIPYNADRGWRLWEGYVGTPVTYGCVLLDDTHAKRLYDLAYIGMPVIIQP